MNDLIKLSDVIKVIEELPEATYEYTDVIHREKAIEKIESIPSAERKGEWIDKGRNLWGCSNCGMEIYSESEQDRNEFHKWCSRCGCRMKGADDE